MKDNIEHTIIKRIRNGETHAFEWLIRKYQKSLFIMAVNFLHNNHQAEDVVQETFLAAYKNFRSFDPGKGCFSTWLFRIARNNCLNAVRKKRENTVAAPPDIAGHDDPMASLAEKEIFEKLNQALDALPERDRMIFILAEFDGLPYAQIAGIEGIRIGTVKSRLSRTRSKLRTLLEKFKR